MHNTDTPDETYEELLKAQVETEREARDLGTARYLKELAEGEDKMPPGTAMIRRAIKPLSLAIKEFSDKAMSGKPGRDIGIAKFACQFQPEALAWIAARQLVRAIGAPKPLSVQTVLISTQN